MALMVSERPEEETLGRKRLEEEESQRSDALGKRYLQVPPREARP